MPSSTRTGRSSAAPGADRRRGRSRSPSAYLKKSGRSIKGFLSAGGGHGGGPHKKSASGGVSVGGRSGGSGGMYVPKIKPPSPTSVMMDSAALEVSSPMSDASGMAVELKLRETKVPPPPADVVVEEKAPKETEDAVVPATESSDDGVADESVVPASSLMAEESVVDGGDASGTDDEVEEAAAAAAVADEDACADVYDLVVEDPPAEGKSKEEEAAQEDPVDEVPVGDDAVEDVEAEEPKPENDDAEVAPTTEEPAAPGAEMAAPSAEVEEDDAVVDTETMNLLLIEPSSRSFEFLQLEFRPDRALVQDILCQVAVTATEEALRGQEYVSICTLRGREMDCGAQLLDFVSSGHRVALAVPLGLTGVDVARLAAPILQDPKIKLVFNSISEEVDTSEDQPPVPPKLELGQMAREDKDAASGVTKAAANRVSRSPLVPPISPREQLTVAHEKVEKKMATTAKPAAPAVAKGEVGVAAPTAPPAEAAGATSTPMLILLAITVLAAVVPPAVVLLHQNISAPLRPGDVLLAGGWRNRCGLLDLVPRQLYDSGCEGGDAVLEMGCDGVLTMYEGGGLGGLWGSITGERGTASWRVLSPSSAGDGSGLQVLDDGTVTIGGRPTKLEQVSSASSSLSPWPFAVEPKWRASPRQEAKGKKEGTKRRNPLLGIFQRK